MALITTMLGPIDESLLDIIEVTTDEADQVKSEKFYRLRQTGAVIRNDVHIHKKTGLVIVPSFQAF